MGNGQEHYQDSPNKPTNNFLPMLCRLSLDDIKHHPRHRRIHLSGAGAGDPGSPKVSCIGQVKRTNRVVGFPSAAATAPHKPHRKPFSAKTLLPNTAALAVAAPAAAGRTCRPNHIHTKTTATSAVKPAKSNCGGGGRVVDLGNMDPPLPVVQNKAADDPVSIWKRRGRNGGEIGRLKIEEIKLQGINNGRFQFHESPTI